VCREELPVVLSLPEILRECEVRQYISSLSLLGKGRPGHRQYISSFSLLGKGRPGHRQYISLTHC
jgi:hypothetical protein